MVTLTMTEHQRCTQDLDRLFKTHFQPVNTVALFFVKVTMTGADGADSLQCTLTTVLS